MKSVEEETPFPYAHRFFRLQPSNPTVSVLLTANMLNYAMKKSQTCGSTLKIDSMNEPNGCLTLCKPYLLHSALSTQETKDQREMVSALQHFTHKVVL